MSMKPPHILAIVGSLHGTSITRVVVQELAGQLQAVVCPVDVLDLSHVPLPFYNPDTAEDQPYFAAIQTRVARADVFILGTPDYNGSISGTLKNFLDHF